MSLFSALFREKSPSFRANYLLNDALTGVEDADLLLLVGTNPRYEAPTFNARIRKCYLQYDLPIGYIGPKNLDMTYTYDHLGAGSGEVKKLLDGSHPFSKVRVNITRK